MIVVSTSEGSMVVAEVSNTIVKDICPSVVLISDVVASVVVDSILVFVKDTYAVVSELGFNENAVSVEVVSIFVGTRKVVESVVAGAKVVLLVSFVLASLDVKTIKDVV